MALNMKSILKASLLIIVIGIVFVVLALILRLIPVLLTGPESETVSLVSTVFSFLLIPIYLAVFFWGGYRATKKFKLDAIHAGAVSALAFFVVGIVQLFLEMILGLLFASHVLAGTFVSGGAALAATVFDATAEGGAGILLSGLCGIAMISIGTLINFVIGGAGSLLAQR